MFLLVCYELMLQLKCSSDPQLCVSEMVKGTMFVEILKYAFSFTIKLDKLIPVAQEAGNCNS